MSTIVAPDASAEAVRPAVPQGPAAHLFSVDVEEYFQVNAFEGHAPRERWPEYPSRLDAGVDAILALLARHSATGTFFTLGWIARHHPRTVRRIAEAGAWFVTRPKTNMRLEVVRLRPLEACEGDGFTLLEDAEVRLASKGDSSLPIPLRRVRLRRDPSR